MIVKSFILENNIKSIIDKNIFLFYGENLGLKRDFKRKIKKELVNSETLNFVQEEIIKNQNILFNEIKNKSLFEEKKLVFIEQVDDKILETIESICQNIGEDRIFMFAGLLDKKSKLRTFFEKSKDLGISACYKDNEITIRNIITKKLKDIKGLSNEIINTIILNTNLDRDKVNNEIEKIISCFHDKELKVDVIRNLLNIETNEDFNALKDEALSGNKDKTNKLLADTILENENIFFYLNIINQRINKLKEIKLLQKKQESVETVIDSMKPPIFWKDKPKVLAQAKKWDIAKINNALKKTYSVELEIKTSNSVNKNLLIKNLIVELCSEANISSTNLR